MPTRTAGPTPVHRTIRGVLVAGYLVLVVLGLTTEVQPRVFWTMVLPLLPISIVLMGFGHWRRVCPLAAFGEIGRLINRGVQRRAPKWLGRWFFLVTFGILLAMLVLRLVATNGDGVWLSGLLIGLAIAALATNRMFTGKTWCNFICPVGIVERIYTEPRSLTNTTSSQCARCTACKSSCPDIDPENAYWKDQAVTGRRIATYAFPGLVLAFYTYFWLRHGDWEAYFDGRWTRIPADAELLLGPGLFFAPGLPALPAAIFTLLVFSAASYLLFTLIEAAVGRFVEDPERRRHLTLALAAFAAFTTFYAFAGAPTLRRLPGGVQAMAFSAPLLGTLFLVRRWGRTREAFIREKGAAKLLRKWPFEEPPPDDPSEVYGWIKASEHARDQNTSAYAFAVREIIADGLVRHDELRLLEGVRTQLGISEREHEQVLARLSEEERDLFSGDHDVGMEERAQLEGYETALAEALLRHASEPEIAELRQAFGIEREVHRQLVEQLRGESGLLLARARAQVERLRDLRVDIVAVSFADATDAEAFLGHLLLREQDRAIRRVLDLLEIAGDSERVRALRFRLLGSDVETRRAATRQLVDACPTAADLIRQLEPWILDREPRAAARDPAARRRTLERHATSTDHYLRAAAVWAAGSSDEDWARDLVARARDDDQDLVRETANRVPEGRRTGAPSGRRFADLSGVERMQLLRGVTLFADLDPQDLIDLAHFGAEEIIEPPATLCEEGDAVADDLFILLDGEAAVLVRGRGDGGSVAEREVAVLGVGEVVGEMSMLDGSPRSATVRPKGGAIRVLRIPGQRFRTRLLPRSRVARPLLLTLAQRIRDMSRRAAGD